MESGVYFSFNFAPIVVKVYSFIAEDFEFVVTEGQVGTLNKKMVCRLAAVAGIQKDNFFSQMVLDL